MLGLLMGGQSEERIESAEDMLGRFTSELLGELPTWKTRLADDPGQLEALERTVHQSFARGADMLVAGLMAIAIADSRFSDTSEKTRR